MKKRFLSLFLILIFLIGTVSAAVPYKESLTIYNYNINEVQCSNNSLRVLVESKASANLNLMFKITSKTTNSIFSNQELKRFETNWFLITTNKACKDLKKIEINGYVNVDNQNIVYLNSGSSYRFTGTESPITQTTTTEILPSTQQTTTTTITSTSNIYFGSKLVETIDSNNEVKYFHQDHLGSNRIITDPNGALVSRLDYEPFGKDLSSNNAKYKFTGKEKDSSSLYYFGARYYDPGIGRFTQVDPSFEPSETPYSYVDNNPLNKIDPDGREAAPADETKFVPEDIMEKFYEDYMDARKQNREKEILRDMITGKDVPNKDVRSGTDFNFVESMVFDPVFWPPAFIGGISRLSIRGEKRLVYYELTSPGVFVKKSYRTFKPQNQKPAEFILKKLTSLKGFINRLTGKTPPEIVDRNRKYLIDIQDYGTGEAKELTPTGFKPISRAPLYTTKPVTLLDDVSLTSLNYYYEFISGKWVHKSKP